MKTMAGLLALMVVALGSSLALAQPASKTSDEIMNVKGIIAAQQSVGCTSSDSRSCRTVLDITAGPTKGFQKPGYPVAAVAPVTVVIMPQTPIRWTRFHRDIAPNQLQPGDAVDIDYQMVGDENIATRVDVSLQ
jgi:hypothetical protein